MASDAANGLDTGPHKLEIVLESSLSPVVGDTALLRATVDQQPYLVQSYRWQIEGPAAGASSIEPTQDGADGSRVSFPITAAGTYSISCEASLEDGRQLRASIALSAASVGAASLTYTARIYPPASTGAPPSDWVVPVADGDRSGLLWVIHEGIAVQLAVHAAASPSAPLPSFVRLIHADQPALPRDLYLPTGQAIVRLSGSFDALFVPEGDQVAPALRHAVDAATLGASWQVELDAGLAVTGTVQQASDTGPLPGAVVTLHSRDAQSGLDVPSTLGRSGTDGAFSLRARPGPSRLTIVPPADSAYPLAVVEAATGLALDGSADGWVFSFAPAQTVTLAGLVTRHDGKTPARGATVLLRSRPIAEVGELNAGGVAYAASGHYRRELRSDDAGRLVDPAAAPDTAITVPRGLYEVVIVPGADEDPAEGRALTEVLLEAQTGAAPTPPTPLALRLAARVPLSGTVLAFDGAPARARVVARGPTGDFVAETDDQGHFAIDLDDALTYAVVVRALDGDRPAGAELAPLLLPDLQVSGAQSFDKLILPRALRLSGTVKTQGNAAVAGALIRIWCSGDGCPARGDIVDETQTGADGSFSLRVPRP